MRTLVRRQESFAATARFEGHGLYEEAVARANLSAVDAARLRLRRRYPESALADLGRHFVTPQAHQWIADGRPAYSVARLIRDVCSAPRPVTFEKASSLEVVFKRPDDVPGMPDVGTPIELGSNVLALEPDKVAAFVEAGGSVELRQFDRHCSEWASVADDVAVLSGADVYLKLFIAGGTRSANGWHHDATDVLATLIDGSKRFEIAGRRDRDALEVDFLLQPGDAVWVPRGLDHRASTTGQQSALISIGFMRAADWAHRTEVPEHLGLHTYPRSTLAYKLSLRPHKPPTFPSSDVPLTGMVQTTAIGGIFVNGASNDDVHVSVNSQSYVFHAHAMDLFLRVHELGPLDVAVLAEKSQLDSLEFAQTLRFLCAERLVTIT